MVLAGYRNWGLGFVRVRVALKIESKFGVVGVVSVIVIDERSCVCRQDGWYLIDRVWQDPNVARVQ